MGRMDEYLTSFAHGPDWWAVFIAVAALATVALMGTFLVAASRAYDRVPAREGTTALPAAGDAPAPIEPVAEPLAEPVVEPAAEQATDAAA